MLTSMMPALTAMTTDQLAVVFGRHKMGPYVASRSRIAVCCLRVCTVA